MNERARPGPPEWARAYVARGWAVLPLHVPRFTPAGTLADPPCSCRRPGCGAPGKHPRVRWERFRERAPDPGDVESWFRRWPRANVGIVTGLVSGVVVLDIDPRNGGEESLRELEEAHGPLPATATVRTGGGGRHLWFAAEGAVAATRPVAPGLDVKGEGGVVVAPPSIHASGRAYEWIVDAPFAPLPAHLTGVAPRGRSGEAPARTPEERAAFADVWRRAGVELGPGDAYYLCPFHPDHHPSLHVDADGCRWHCFGCGRGGGIGALRAELGLPPETHPRARLEGVIGEPRPVTMTVTGEDIPVVGESEHQDVLLRLTGGRRSFGGVDMDAVADLVPVDDGVEVLVEGEVVGRLRREDAARLRREIIAAREAEGAATAPALIRGGWDRGGDDVGLFGVVLRL